MLLENDMGLVELRLRRVLLSLQMEENESNQNVPDWGKNNINTFVSWKSTQQANS